MAHGTPDWGGAAPQTVSSPVADLGELAARLGSVDTVNRQGNVILFDDFSGGLHQVTQYVTGASSYTELSRAFALAHGWSAHLYADGSAGARAAVNKFSPVPQAGHVSAEWMVAYDVYAQYIEFDLVAYAGATAYQGEVRLDYVNHALQYLNNAAVWTTFATNVYLTAWVQMFHSFKLVVDSVNGNYLRFIADGIVYSLAGIALYSAAVSPTNYIISTLTNWSNAPNPNDAYAGGCILTINEP